MKTNHLNARVLSLIAFASMTLSAAAASASGGAAPQDWSRLQDIDVLYTPINPNPIAGVGVKNCLDKTQDGWQTMPKDAKGQLLKECQPDTLYLWLPAEKIQAISETIGDGAWPESLPTLFAAKGAIATFGYGAVSIRIKLKPGVRFAPSPVIDNNCNNYSPKDYENTVFYRNDNWFGDWTICSPDVIHSWSYGTKGHYDEMIRDMRTYRSILTKPNGDLHGQVELYSGYQAFDPFQRNMDADFTNFTFDSFVRTLHGEKQLVDSGHGRIFYNPDLPAAERSPSRHFQSNEHMYFMAD